MNSLSARFLATAGRHFVTLSCIQRPPGSGGERHFVFSGFLVEAGGVWFYVTAGHILRDIRASLESGATYSVWRLGDNAADNRFKGIGIPIAFEIEDWLVIENSALGLDYAVVALDELYCMQLKAGGASPLDKTAWGDHVSQHDHLALVGIPSETIVHNQKTVITARITVIPLEPAKRPALAGRKAKNQFYARIKELGTIRDIDGMSGGPVFALNRHGQEWKYKVIGVQSGWYPRTQTITACPFASLGAELERAVEAAKASKPETDLGSQ